MTAKAPTPMPEGMNRDNRPKAPAAPPSKFREGSCRHEPKTAGPRPDLPPPAPIVRVDITVIPEPRYPVYAFGMWMWFESQSVYLDWQDRLGYGK